MSEQGSQDKGEGRLPPKPVLPDYATKPEVYRNPPEVHAVTLSAEDAAAVDRLLENGYGGDDGTPDGDERSKRVAGWLGVLGAHRAAQPPIDLLARTRAAAQLERMKVEPVGAGAAVAKGNTFSRRLVEYSAMAIAASVLVMVLIPGIGQARATAKRVACADNLRVVAKSFDGFAADHGNALPSLASPKGANWQPRELSEAKETEHSNTANVLPLVRGKYLTEPMRLACPAAGAAVIPAGWTSDANELPASLRGYSYTCMYSTDKPRWDRKTTTIVLADANPLFPSGCESIHENSHNHAGKGSMVLYADASARWQTSPDVGPEQDNIWTVAGKATEVAYTGTEAPTSLADVFLAP